LVHFHAALTASSGFENQIYFFGTRTLVRNVKTLLFLTFAENFLKCRLDKAIMHMLKYRHIR